MTPAEALKLALEKEISSIEMYEKLSIEHPAIKDIFYFLKGEEEKHKLWVEKKIAELMK